MPRGIAAIPKADFDDEECVPPVHAANSERAVFRRLSGNSPGIGKAPIRFPPSHTACPASAVIGDKSVIVSSLTRKLEAISRVLTGSKGKKGPRSC